MKTAKEILDEYNRGEWKNKEDEKYAGGFWDYAGDIAGSYQDKIMDTAEVMALQEAIYNSFMELISPDNRPDADNTDKLDYTHIALNTTKNQVINALIDVYALGFTEAEEIANTWTIKEIVERYPEIVEFMK